MATLLYFDGGCSPTNPGGIATFGFVVKSDDQVVHRESGLAAAPFDPAATNNTAEYVGLVKGLEWLLASGIRIEEVEVRGDSQLVINQMTGAWRIKKEHLRKLNTTARELASRLPGIRFVWIARDENWEADAEAGGFYASLLAGDGALRERVAAHAATGAQRQYLERLGVAAPPHLSRMEASRLIDQARKAHHRTL